MFRPLFSLRDFLSSNEEELTLKEELFNSLSHSLGILLGVYSLVITMQISSNILAKISFLIYSSSLIFLYSASTLYHAIQDKKWKVRLRLLDYITIYFFIAGNYTPVCLLVLKSTLSYVLLACVWVVALFGVVLKIWADDFMKKYSTILYIVMSWISIFLIKELLNKLPLNAIILLIVGGFIYTVGVFFYIQKIKYFHGIWHIFVLLASLFHFLFFFLYLM